MNNSVAVIGIGRVGLPLALVLAKEGYQVYGVDVDKKMVEGLKKSKMPFLEKGAESLLKALVNKSFFPTLDKTVVKKCGYIILTLGTPVDENMNPSLTQIDKTIESIKTFIKPGQVLILRSTVSPRTTRYVKNRLNKVKDIKVGDNFFLAFCPERIAEGEAIEELYQIPQIIGGINQKSSQKAAELFKVLKVKCWLTDSISAELAKLFTNMYRYISFAIANEFMILAGKYNRDIYKIVELVNREYKRGGLAMPGLTGGACLFKDGFFLINDIPYVDLIATAWKINEAVPLFLVENVRNKIDLTDKKAVILGAAFKADIDDIRESLSFKIKKALEREGAVVQIHDPLIKKYQGNLNQVLKGASLVFVATKHSQYIKSLTAEKMKKLVDKNCLICDVWNVFETNQIIFSVSEL